MDFDCVELERRLAIGFNDHMTLARRHSLVLEGLTLEEMQARDERFNPYTRETRDVIHWLSRSTRNSIIWYRDGFFPSFNPLRAHLPYMLFCEGTPPAFGSKVAIVGTRHATYGALQQAFRFGLEAAENSVCVVSGFAEGVDQSAMNGSISGGGPCIGLLACGHEVEYPALTRMLRRRILDTGGCILSRFPPSEMAYKSNFLSRNMVISAYGDFAVAVQAPERSGTLNTCDYTMQMGKEVYVGSEGVGDRFVQVGTSALFRDGAKVIASMAEIPSLDVHFGVVECQDGQEEPMSGKDGLKRFGDRRYMVRELIC